MQQVRLGIALQVIRQIRDFIAGNTTNYDRLGISLQVMRHAAGKIGYCIAGNTTN